MSQKTVVHSKVKPKPMGHWSHGIIVPADSRICFPGGFTSRDSEGNVVGAYDAEAQTRQILTNLRDYCEELGATLEDVVKLTVYITDMRDWEVIHKVRREFFTADPPASCLVQVTRMVDERHKLEMDPIIMLPS